MRIKYISIRAVAVSVLWRIASKLIETRAKVYMDYTQSVNLAEDCTLHTFATRYNKICAEIKIDPPTFFPIMWINEALKQVNWCAPFMCEDVFSYTGLVMIAITFAIVQATAVAVPRAREHFKKIKF